MSAQSLTLLQTICRTVGLWLARLGGWTSPEACPRLHWPPLPPLLLTRAVELVDAQERENLHGSGENKRHLVYSRLLKEFPREPRTYLALAIEYARATLMEAP